MIKLITDQKEIVKYHKIFESQMQPFVSWRKTASVGFQGANVELRISYSKELGIWWSFTESGNAFWNPFGLDEPSIEQSNHIVCEINYVKTGRLTSRSGAFGINESNDIILLHSGRIGGGRKGIGQTLFLENFVGDILDVQFPDKIKRYAPIGALESKRFPYQVALFIKEIARIKQLPYHKKDYSLLKSIKDRYNKEFIGKKQYEQKKNVIAQCDHGLVVDSLRQILNDLGFRTANDIRDLFTLNSNKEIDTVFEFKTDVSTQSLYTAVGQLLLNNLHFHVIPKLVLVVPSRLPSNIESVLKDLKISLLFYSWKDDKPIFKNIKKVLYK